MLEGLVNLMHGSWQMKLDVASSIAFATSFLQKYLQNTIFENISEVTTMMDDIIVLGSTKEEHDT